jgi:hypothetical protein
MTCQESVFSGIPTFVGSVQDYSFKLRRDIRYRNSFLPRIRGHLVVIPSGTRVMVLMFVHPGVGVFMMFWLGITGYAALKASSSSANGIWGMFAFGLALLAAGFFPEAKRAKRLLLTAINESKRT